MLTRKAFCDLIEFLRSEGVIVTTEYRRDGPHVEIQGCDGTDRNACAWASLRGLDLGTFQAFLDELGTPCDCTIIMDVDPKKLPGTRWGSG